MTQIEHTQMCGLSPGYYQPSWNKHTPKLYPLAGDDYRLTYSNGAVQIQVGLELAEEWAFACENGLQSVEPTFYPLSDPFWDIDGTHLNPIQSGGKK